MRKTLQSQLLYILLSLSLSACLSGPSKDLPSESCTKVVTKEIRPQIKGGHHLYFDINEFAFLSEPGFVIDSVSLNATLRGKHKETQELSISVNGIKATRKDGEKSQESLTYDSSNDKSNVHYKLHKFFLNGAEPFHLIFAKLKTNKGELKLSLLANSVFILDASISVSGKAYQSCPSPSPTPTPEPVAPTTRIDSVEPNAALTSSTQVAIAFSSDTPGSSQFCSLDGAEYVNCQSPAIYAGLADGAHSFRVYSVSPHGLRDVQTPSHSWSVDSAPSDVTITNLADLKTLTNSQQISFNLAASEAGQLRCQLDSQAEVDCDATASYSNLSEGQHSFSAVLVDLAGNRSSNPAQFSWIVDLTAPVAIITQVEPALAIINSHSKTIQFNANESANFECSIDHGAYQACASPLEVTRDAEGVHWFEVRAVDSAGNTGLSASYSWSIDTTAPELSLVNTVPTQGLTSARQISVEFASNEPAETRCQFDGAPAATCSSPFTAELSADGVHTLVISAKDLAGNESNILQLEWNADFSSPIISFGAFAPSSSQYINSANFSVELISNEQVAFSASVDGSAAAGVASPLVLTGLSEGAHRIDVTGVDQVGLPSNAISHEFVVDLTAPQAVLLANDDISPTRLDSRSFTFTSNEAGTLECQLDSAGFSECTSPASLSGLGDGEHTFSVRARDLAGNASAVVSNSWVVDTLAPTTSLSASQAGNAITFSFSADESFVSFFCSFDGATEQFCSSPVAYSGIAAGTHSFRVRAIDEAGNQEAAGATHNFIVIEPITTRITAVSPDALLTSSRSRTISFEASRAASGFQCSFNGAAAQPCSSPITYFDLVDGNYSFKVQAIDEYGNVDQIGATNSWTVDGTAPVILSQSVSAGSTSITVTWTTNEGASSFIYYGRDPAFGTTTVETFSYGTTHRVTISGLARNASYSIQVSGRDRAGNVYLGSKRSVRTLN